MRSEREPIAVIGTGYVGLVTAAGFAELGSEVWCVDVDAEKVERLRRGEIPIYEPGLEELVARHRDRLHFDTELGPALEHARLLFVAVGTPPTYSGDADLSAVRAVVDSMPASDHHALVMKSTVPVGTGDSICRHFAEHGKEGFSYVSCPEFLKEGSAVKDFLNPDRVVVGDIRDWAGDAVAELYAPLGAELLRTDVASAEMIKLASNAFLATKISFINEIAVVCEEVGADVKEVAHGMGTDSRIGPRFLNAGIGWGGSCFGKDVTALKKLAANTGYQFQLLNASLEVNELQKRRVVAKLQKHLGALAGKRVGLLGLAFKPNTDDMRDAASLVLAARMQADGARVAAYDPVAMEEAGGLLNGVEFADSALAAVDGADALVLVTEWAEFGELDWSEVAGAMAGRLVVDGRNFLDPEAVRRAGLVYEGIGREVGDRAGGRLMQALVLAGGEGTRLRPLTSTMPKPVVPLVDRPFIVFMLEWLTRHGVDHVVLSCGYLAAGVRNVLGDGSGLGLRIDYVEEREPLGTGGAVKYAEELLDDRFLVLNGDVLTDMDLTAQIAHHERTGARATLALIGVEDPSAYGLVRTEGDGEVTAFLEKPSSDQIDTNLINAGAYVLEKEILAGFPEGASSIERDVFPALIGQGLSSYAHEAYWLDIGTPERYLQGTWDILESAVETGVAERLGPGFLHVADPDRSEGRVVPPALVEPGVRIAAGAQIGSRVVLSDDVTVGEHTHVERTVVHRGAEIGPDCRLADCIIGAGARIGAGCHIDGGVVLGEGVTIGAGNVLTAGARIFPGVELGDEAIKF